MFPAKVFFEPAALEYELGRQLQQRYREVPWIEIENHNRIEELTANPNTEFARMKNNYLIVGTRKTHKYVPNHKVSDYLVPFTSSGCSAMCLYCYLVCSYNKCSYLRLFVNREQMMDKLLRTARSGDGELTFEIGSNSDLVLENTITGNLPWVIEKFAMAGRGFITFPTKFAMIEPLLPLQHRGRVIFRMSVNPEFIIRRVEIGTSPLKQRVDALNRMAAAGYQVGLLIAPVVLLEDWEKLYRELIEQLADQLSEQVKREGFIEVIFMTYSYVHNAINSEAFPNAAPIYDKEIMTGRGRGKYCYRQPVRESAGALLQELLARQLPGMEIKYMV